SRPGPDEPGGEVFGAEPIALDGPAAGLGVDGVQIDTMFTWQEAQSLVEISAQLLGVAGLAGIVAGGLDAATGQALVVLEAADVVALPAVQRQRDGAEDFEGAVRADAEASIAL